MDSTAIMFSVLGAAFLLGLAADAVGGRTSLPRVTTVLVFGFLAGPEVFNLFPEGFEVVFQRGAEIALTMVGFLLGERLVHSICGGDGRAVLWVSVIAVAFTAAVVFLGLWLAGLSVATALLLSGIATATAPAATVDVVRQSGSKGRFSQILLGVVAVDDAWGLLCFSLLMAAAGMVAGNGDSAWAPVSEGIWEMGVALLIGGGLGLVMSIVTGRISSGEPSLLEAIGFVFLACGLAIGAGVSFILTAMIMGSVVALVARHYERPFHSIEGIELPFMILFFMLAGASLDLEALKSIGWFGAAYVVLRFLARMGGGWLGARLAGESAENCRLMGLGLMPQAGVALGMALVAAQKFPEEGTLILQITIGSTVFFELFGPMMTRFAVNKAEQFEEAAGEKIAEGGPLNNREGRE